MSILVELPPELYSAVAFAAFDQRVAPNSQISCSVRAGNFFGRAGTLSVGAGNLSVGAGKSSTLISFTESMRRFGIDVLSPAGVINRLGKREA